MLAVWTRQLGLWSLGARAVTTSLCRIKTRVVCSLALGVLRLQFVCIIRLADGGRNFRKVVHGKNVVEGGDGSRRRQQTSSSIAYTPPRYNNNNIIIIISHNNNNIIIIISHNSINFEIGATFPVFYDTPKAVSDLS